MTFFQSAFRSPLHIAGLCTAAVVLLTSCANPAEPLPEEPVEAQEVVTIGGALSAPGLANGTDPGQVHGAEVELGKALAQTFSESSVGVDTRWRALPRDPDDAAGAHGEVQLVIGQLNTAVMSDALGWVGPYATVEPALLVRQAGTSEELLEPTPVELPTVVTLEDLQQAAVCVVADSLADGAELPAASVTVQLSVTECETGMRSGRFDAIAADDLQLAGLFLDPVVASDYDLVYWSALVENLPPGDEPVADANDPEEAQDAPEFVLDEQLLRPGQYWVGVAPEHCALLAEELTRLLSEGGVEQAFAEFDQLPYFALQLPSALDVTTQHCDI